MTGWAQTETTDGAPEPDPDSLQAHAFTAAVSGVKGAGLGLGAGLALGAMAPNTAAAITAATAAAPAVIAGVAGGVAADIVTTTAWNTAMADLAATGHAAAPAVATVGQQAAELAQLVSAQAGPPLAHAAAAAEVGADAAFRTCMPLMSRAGDSAAAYWKVAAAGALTLGAHAAECATAAYAAAGPYAVHICIALHALL